MRSKIIACEMLRPEIEFIRTEGDIPDDMIWIEAALHLTPKKLHRRLQEIFDGLDDCDRVFMPFGDCGGALTGLRTGDFETLIPRVDDCLSLLIGSQEERERLMREEPTFFLSLGWLKQESSIFAQHEYTVKKYGEKLAASINKSIYGSYKRTGLIDTGVGSREELMRYEKPLLEIFGMKKLEVRGSVDYLRALFLGPWPEALFRRIPPRSVISFLRGGS